MLAIGNMQIGVWQNELDGRWSSLYDPNFNLGIVSSGSVFGLPDEVNILSPAAGACVEVKRLDGSSTCFSIVPFDQLSNYGKGYCAQSGRTLLFAREFKPGDAEFGGTIVAPVYQYADTMSNPTDTVPVDDPNWLVLASAAQAASASLIKAGQYANIVGEANSLMDAMKQRNRSAGTTNGYRPFRPFGRSW